MNRYYFGYLNKTNHLFDLTINLGEGTNILCPRVVASKLIPKVRDADKAEDDLTYIEFLDFGGIKSEEELKLVTDILSDKPIWITNMNVPFISKFATYFDIEEIITTINSFLKCQNIFTTSKLPSNALVEQFIRDNGEEALHAAAATTDPGFCFCILDTKRYDINKRIKPDGIFFFINWRLLLFLQQRLQIKRMLLFFFKLRVLK